MFIINLIKIILIFLFIFFIYHVFKAVFTINKNFKKNIKNTKRRHVDDESHYNGHYNGKTIELDKDQYKVE